MTAIVITDLRPKGGLGAQLLAHLRAQTESARRLLDVVLEQKAAIRARDVHGVVRLAGVMRGEIGRRELIDGQRAQLLQQSGEQLRLAPERVTLSAIAELLDAEQGDRAQANSAELRGLLHELQREHAANQALMRVELGFLDHLMRMLSLDAGGGYGPRGNASPTSPPRTRGELRVLDLRA
ncbi:MAG TPA: flagellar export chaperone FlgN [Solirubrobacteraceae bacterium]|nr:flagellar export chaperone FlgN [Solirubrobacteraceae bacterium]